MLIGIISERNIFLEYISERKGEHKRKYSRIQIINMKNISKKPQKSNIQKCSQSPTQGIPYKFIMKEFFDDFFNKLHDLIFLLKQNYSYRAQNNDGKYVSFQIKLAEDSSSIILWYNIVYDRVFLWH